MEGEVLHITDDSFDDAVLKSQLPIIVDFWAPWCGPCKMIGPILESIAKEYAGKLVIAKVNTDDYTAKAMEYGVQSLPTLLFFKNGEVVNRHIGSLPSASLHGLVDEFLA